ncbi:cbdb2440-5f9e-4382-9b39-1985fce29fd3 [Sclerotinia trifoliorum]|uniref:RBR-type E3 ubiquitin transferase n=1 Tax=Sclerotinia trifoliorum TaxID=28548 RepID=A0A8H2VUT3_9HELO|nr:cbdb2440-5f9e-4382-9b39-1985fce29fd3 [Sclerotinia trifoliorum]
MAGDNTDGDDPQSFLGRGLPEYSKLIMHSILKFVGEKRCATYNKSQLMRRLHEAQNAGRISTAQRTAIKTWLAGGSTDHISDHYTPPNGQFAQPQASRVTKKRKRTPKACKRTKNSAFEHEESLTPAPELRECSICAEEVNLADFPHQISSGCMHDPTCCRTCLSRSIGVQIESKPWDQITCLECPALLSFDNVKSFASEADFITYDRNVLLYCIRSDPNFTNCLGPGCGGGQVHEDGDDQPIMTCGDCSFKTCFTHKMPWHTGLTCDQYNTREREKLQQEEASQKLMEKATKKCPKCQVRIEKNKGCDHMTCRFCKHEFCWMCFADYKLIRSRDNSAHTPTCTYYAGVPLRHQTNYLAWLGPPARVDHFMARARALPSG